jgi:glyoxylase-like metal-dependent hydrolase (beta-lactamase superfamily II)
MPTDDVAFEVVVNDIEHQGMRFDVRCFLVPHATGIVLVDTGVPGTVPLIDAGLDRRGARWADVTDIVLTHKHFDHVASLTEAVALAGDPAVWVGAEDRQDVSFAGSISSLVAGNRVRDLITVATPGHTLGHRSFLHEPSGVLFAGDVAGTVGGVLRRGPEPFTEDAVTAERTLWQLADMPWTRAVFSHGPEVADPRGDLRRLLEAPPSPGEASPEH